MNLVALNELKSTRDRSTHAFHNLCEGHGFVPVRERPMHFGLPIGTVSHVALGPLGCEDRPERDAASSESIDPALRQR